MVSEVSPETCGSIAYTGIIRMRPKIECLERSFLRHFLKSRLFAVQAERMASGSVLKHYGPTHLRQMTIALPPTTEQRAIARVLDALDDKIELNRKMSATLEAIARALFKSWFIDFDPVRAKAEGRDTALPVNVAAMFPDSFEDSGAREVPTGWRAGSLGEVAVNLRRGISANDIKDGTPYIGLEHMPRRSLSLCDWSQGNGLESNKFVFRHRELLFGKLRPYFHKVGVAPLDGVCSTDILVADAACSEWYGFVMMHLCSDALITHTEMCSTGTKMPRAAWEHIARYEVVLPPAVVAKSFAALVSPMVDRIVAGIHESRTLAALRDALLPKLVSGEICAIDTERMVEQSA